MKPLVLAHQPDNRGGWLNEGQGADAPTVGTSDKGIHQESLGPSTPAGGGRTALVGASPDNQAKTTAWLEEEVLQLQRLLQELQRSCNVTAAMHDKQVR